MMQQFEVGDRVRLNEVGVEETTDGEVLVQFEGTVTRVRPMPEEVRAVAAGLFGVPLVEGESQFVQVDFDPGAPPPPEDAEVWLLDNARLERVAALAEAA